MNKRASTSVALAVVAALMAGTPAVAEEPSQENKTEQTALPDVFFKAVRGCSTDGYIYRMTYNLSVDFGSVAALSDEKALPHEKSLLDRHVQPNPDSVLGVSGTDRFMDTLNTITANIHNAMQVSAGTLIDRAESALIDQDSFGEIIKIATDQIATDIQEKYGVGITIHTSHPTKQEAGRCAPAAPPELLPNGPGQ
ncbi:MAG: hypothetical protein H6867_08160 [Rhodospirillales bacterium]|nr:hypothetical protein [Rhodospirillales bacterium]MCB9995529.1 hypothetical protein [Rhodospirillales bacterium]